jgi:hypothetical protein
LLWWGAQDELQKAEDEAAKAKADAEADASDDGEGESLAGKLRARLEGIFDLPALAPHKGAAQPLLDLLAKHEGLVFAVLGLPALLLLLPLLSLLGGSKVLL